MDITINDLFKLAVNSMMSNFDYKYYRLAATYGQLACQYALLLDELDREVGEEDEKND